MPDQLCIGMGEPMLVCRLITQQISEALYQVVPYHSAGVDGVDGLDRMCFLPFTTLLLLCYIVGYLFDFFLACRKSMMA